MTVIRRRVVIIIARKHEISFIANCNFTNTVHN